MAERIKNGKGGKIEKQRDLRPAGGGREEGQKVALKDFVKKPEKANIQDKIRNFFAKF